LICHRKYINIKQPGRSIAMLIGEIIQLHFVKIVDIDEIF